jgi:hypothetical protein
MNSNNAVPACGYAASWFDSRSLVFGWIALSGIPIRGMCGILRQRILLRELSAQTKDITF